MINHVSIGVRNIAEAKRFYDATFAPLGYNCLSHDDGSLGYGRDPVAFWINAAEHPVTPDDKSGLHFCVTAPPHDKASMPSMRQHCSPEAGTTASLAYGPTTGQNTTRRSSLIRRGTASRPTVGAPRSPLMDRADTNTE
jgi:catechol 2,3-dioxygenase-like lactoylglutathione lyase family enzyme